MSEESENKNKTISFRVPEETWEAMNDLDRSMSEVYRGVTDLYREEPFFRNGVDAYLNGDVDSFEEYAEAYFEAAAEEYSPDLAQQLEEQVDPDEVVGPLRDYLAAVNFGDRRWAEQAAEDFYDVSDELGDFFTTYTGRFSESQWDSSLE